MCNYRNNNLKSTVSLSEYRGYCARKQLGIMTKRKTLLLLFVVVVVVVVVLVVVVVEVVVVVVLVVVVVVKITILCIK
jgi:Flp pilus assembly protein TadB